MFEGVRRYSGNVFLDGEDGMYLHAHDVADAWAAKLAAIRAAVEAEREAADTERYEYGADRAADVPWSRSMQDASDIYDQARAALDALLAVTP